MGECPHTFPDMAAGLVDFRLSKSLGPSDFIMLKRRERKRSVAKHRMPMWGMKPEATFEIRPPDRKYTGEPA